MKGDLVSGSVDLDQVLRAVLDETEEQLRAGHAGAAELALNRAAGVCRALGVPNVSRRYRALSFGAVQLRIEGRWRPGGES